jgi:hypothetical protein
VLVFRRRRADRIKTLVWDGSGLMLIWKGSIGRGFTCRGSRGRRRLGERRDKVNRGGRRNASGEPKYGRIRGG